MKNEAYFISPDGKIIPITFGTHIDMVIRYPKKFKLSKEEIEKIHKKYHEPIGSEGKARDQILLNLLNQGWIRIRHYSDQGYWSVQIGTMNKRIKDYLFDFANKAITGKKPFKSAVWDNEIMKIVSFKDNKTWNFNFKDISNDILYSESVKAEIPNVKRYILECVPIEDYHPKKDFNEFIGEIND